MKRGRTIGLSITIVAVVSGFALGLALRAVPPEAWILAAFGTLGLTGAMLIYFQVIATRDIAAALTTTLELRLEQHASDVIDALQTHADEVAVQVGTLNTQVARVEKGLTGVIGLYEQLLDNGNGDPVRDPGDTTRRRRS